MAMDEAGSVMVTQYKPSAIKICGNEVRILRRGFCVGDVYMTWDQYDKIGERR